jgi:hypothetical protein
MLVLNKHSASGPGPMNAGYSVDCYYRDDMIC